jgi:geranylgeranyl reductase family protein
VERVDVLIVGGGPAGSTLAWLLARQGIDVMVMDQREFPRDKPCAGWVTPTVLRLLELDTADYARRHVLQPIHRFRVGMIGGRETLTRRSPDPLSWGILRRELDHYLLRRSRARLRLGLPVRDLRREGGEWVVNDQIRAPLVVGAGGHFCPVARRIGARTGLERVVLAQEIEFEPERSELDASRAEPGVPELLFCRDLKGYGWVFRKGRHLNVGLGREDPRDLGDHVRVFVSERAARRRIPPSTPPRLRGHAYALYSGPPRRVTADGVLLIGDAAGLADARSGEGIAPAIESAVMAAEVVVAARGELGGARLSRYADRLTARFGPRETGGGLVSVLPPSVRSVLAGRLLATEWFARRVVCERWFLHARGRAHPGQQQPLEGSQQPSVSVRS